ncbi:MAG: 2OG-Fe(II) oxygenase [Kofleriaceae bacterium]
MPSVLIADRFAAEAARLRSTFDDRFADPRSTRADRFVWDYWHVPGQYTALRTPAWTYFPRSIYQAFHRRLVDWGRETLGCHDISPPWLSLYLDGCGQELHGDLPHGPWAFVFSLTHWRGRAFRGGETMLLRDEVLEFWQDFASVRGVEQQELIKTIEPAFNRLTVFDPRVPHGVKRVSGTHDPREGRLVIHGWFVQPRPFIQGALSRRAVASRIAELTEQLNGWVGSLSIAGMVSVRFTVDRRGRAGHVQTLSDTTRVPRSDELERKRLIKKVRTHVADWRFGPQRGASHVTLPIVFERG